MAAEKPIRETLNPSMGGQYLRDPKTGALTRVEDQPAVEQPTATETNVTTAKDAS